MGRGSLLGSSAVPEPKSSLSVLEVEATGYRLATTSGNPPDPASYDSQRQVI